MHFDSIHLSEHLRVRSSAIFISGLLIFFAFQSVDAIQMKGRVRFVGGVGGERAYSEKYYYYGYNAYGCRNGDCTTNKGGVIRFYGTTPFKAKGGGRAKLLGGTFTMKKTGSRSTARGRYGGDIFAVFSLNGQEYIRYGNITVRVRKRVLRTPFGRLKLRRDVQQWNLHRRQIFRGSGSVKVNVSLR